MFCMTHESSPLLSNSYQNVGWRLPHQRPKVLIDTLLHLGEEQECVKGWSKFRFPCSLSLCFPKLTQYYSFAFAEIYISIATLFRRFKFQLYDTEFERDVKVVRDNFLGEPCPESKGVRVKIVSEVL